ncbi:hypothetical protein CB1_000880025 [Camelus ferus]|nr:hypothetical protein CB1_000880025 [Camelus ferus]
MGPSAAAWGIHVPGVPLGSTHGVLGETGARRGSRKLSASSGRGAGRAGLGSLLLQRHRTSVARKSLTSRACGSRPPCVTWNSTEGWPASPHSEGTSLTRLFEQTACSGQ